MSAKTIKQSKTVVIACGGTGGHLFPGIAVAEQVRARGGTPIVLISEKEIDRLASQSYPKLEFISIPSRPKPKLLSTAVFSFIASLWKSWRHVRRIMKERNPHAVLGMGGFTSLMPLIAGHKVGARCFLHESNAIPGKANRFCAKHADTVFVGWKECAPHFPDRPVEVVGTPLRESMQIPPSREAAAAKFGLDPNQPVLLVAGGSQGARGINRATVEALPKFPKNWQILHITGPADYDECLAGYTADAPPHHVVAFCHEMEYACALATVALVRSGASTLNELAAFGIPSILVPYPFAADDHQTLNARIFSAAGAATILPQSDLTPDSLAAAVSSWLNDPAAFKSACQAARSLHAPDSALQITTRIMA